MKQTTRIISLLTMILVMAYALVSFMSVAQAEQVYTPWNDNRPAKPLVTDAVRVTDPAILKYADSHRPTPKTLADKLHANSRFTMMSSYQAYAGIDFKPTFDKGMQITTSVLGGLTLSKPNSSVDAGVVSGSMQVYKSCLVNYFWAYSPPGYSTTLHSFVVEDTCSGGYTLYTVDATTWTKYTTTGTMPSITDAGVNISDKYSIVRNYQWSPSTSSLAVQVWNLNTSSYDTFGVHSGNNPGGNPDSYVDFLHYGDTTVNGSYCVALGAWNVAQTSAFFKWTGTAMAGLFPADIYGSYLDTGEPCYNTSSGNSSWYFVANTTGLTIPAWSICGPSNTQCRP